MGKLIFVLWGGVKADDFSVPGSDRSDDTPVGHSVAKIPGEISHQQSTTRKLNLMKWIQTIATMKGPDRGNLGVNRSKDEFGRNL
jgi:hypothetical protein